jgi:hypothetical protein
MEKNPVGAPPMYKDPSELASKIQEYFDSLKETREPETITGLAYFLGFESRQSFYDYEAKPEFTYTVKRARLAIEGAYEARLHGNSNAGAIFALKNFGWIDTQAIDHTSKGNEMKSFTLNVKPDAVE